MTDSVLFFPPSHWSVRSLFFDLIFFSLLDDFIFRLTPRRMIISGLSLFFWLQASQARPGRAWETDYQTKGKSLVALGRLRLGTNQQCLRLALQFATGASSGTSYPVR